LDLVRIGALVQPPLATHLVLEVLHGVGDEGFAAVNAGVFQRPVEQASGGSDERMTRAVLLVPRLLADEHDSRPPPPLTRHRLGGAGIERAARALFLGFGEPAEAADRLG